MKCALAISMACLTATAALGSPPASSLHRVRGIHYARVDLADGTISPMPQTPRIGESVWAATWLSGAWWGQMNWPDGTGSGVISLDWGDVAPQTIGGFAFGYGTTVLEPERIDCITTIYANDNGFNSATRTPLAQFLITQLPTATPYGWWYTWIITVDLEESGASFLLTGDDLDADGLSDFSYSFYYPGAEGTGTGPLIAGVPNVEGQGAGMEDAFDIFGHDPNDPNTWGYVGTYSFGGDPFAQFYLELFGEANMCDCCNPGASGNYCTADIDGSWDCIVNLADLAVLLSNYGMTSGATHNMGDLEGNDGDVDIADLAALLGQYNDDCN